MDRSETRLFLGLTGDTKYPEAQHGYGPTENYPELRFEARSVSARNRVYATVRQGFYALGYDAANFGSNRWNPLGHVIKPGSTVLVKPNWVFHQNRGEEGPGALECLVTHPSVVRVLIDYVEIALGGRGQIIVADAPMQGCDLDLLLRRSGYLRLFEHLTERGSNIDVRDLRQVRVQPRFGGVVSPQRVNADSEGVRVDATSISAHRENPELRFKVSDYSTAATSSYHRDGWHNYSISRAALDADVIINIPKPKTHRLAGITAAKKNLVGLIFDKASLPHRTLGSVEAGGDEYPKESRLKAVHGRLEEAALKAAADGKVLTAVSAQTGVNLARAAIRTALRDKVLLGSWSENDTVWRMVEDLHRIALFCDRKGVLQSSQQRQILNVADMVVAGEGNGPVSPSPKHLGMILIGETSAGVDVLVSRIMGFEAHAIPSTRASLESISPQSITVVSNVGEYSDIALRDFRGEPSWGFRPHRDWL